MSNWEDTVMHLDDIDEGRMPDSYSSLRKVLEKQAEVTWLIAFREGQKEEVEGYQAGISKLLDKSEHPVFWKNCKAQRKCNAKLCQDCPFRQVIIEQGNSAMPMRYGKLEEED